MYASLYDRNLPGLIHVPTVRLHAQEGNQFIDRSMSDSATICSNMAYFSLLVLGFFQLTHYVTDVKKKITKLIMGVWTYEVTQALIVI